MYSLALKSTDAGVPQDSGADFDPSFYGALYRDLSGWPQEDLYRHWVEVGRSEKRIGSVRTLLQQHGLQNASWFIDNFSGALYRDLNIDVPWNLNTDAEALYHFLTEGLNELRHFSDEHRFDCKFYKLHHHDLCHMSDGDAYRHWLVHGVAEGRAGSPKEFLARLGLQLEQIPKAFNWHTYVDLNPDLSEVAVSPWHAFEHLCSKGIAESRQTGLKGKEGGDLLFLIGRGHRMRRNTELALQAFQCAVLLNPENGLAYEELGNCYFDTHRYYEAFTAYERAIEIGNGTVWANVNAANSLINMMNVDRAINHLESAHAAAPGWRYATLRLCQASQMRFDINMRMAHAAALRQNYQEAQRIAKYAACSAVPVTTQPYLAQPLQRAQSPTRIVALVDDALRQCMHYRVLQKQEHARASGLQYEYFPASNVKAFRNRLPFADVALFYRVPATPSIAEAISYAKSIGLPTIYEIDDLIFDEESYPDTFESYGGLITPDEYAGLVTGVPLFRCAMEMCDYGLASTPALAGYMEKVVRTGICHVHRNALSLENVAEAQRIMKAPRADRGCITIFYGSGTKAHNSDFDELASNALSRILSIYRHVRLVVVGYLTLPDAFKPYEDRIHRIEFIPDYATYRALLQNADINIAVLTRNAMNDCKSEIKWLEAAAYGVPSVVSNTATYTEILDDGQSALIASTPDQWFHHLTTLVVNTSLRHRIGQQARDLAFAQYSPRAMGENIARIIKSVCSTTYSDTADGCQVGHRKKIMIVNVFFPPQSIGGATRVVRDNVDVLLDVYSERYDVVVFSAEDGNPEPYQVDKYYYRETPVIRVSTPLEVGMDWRWENSSVGHIFSEALDREKPDLVHFHCIQRLTTSIVDETQKAGIPYIVTVHDAWWISDHQFLIDNEGRLHDPSDPFGIVAHSESPAQSIRRLSAMRAALHGAEAVLAVSESFANIYRKAGIGNVVALPNGLPYQPEVQHLPGGAGKVRLAHIGGMSAHKGFNILRRALIAQKLDNLELTVVDHGAPHGSSREEQWGDTLVRIIGKVPQERICELYALHDVLVAPSIWPESYGLVTREAAAVGLWIIASNRGAIGEDVVDGENGFIIDVNDSRHLAKTLASINADPEKFMRPPPSRRTMRHVRDQVSDLVEIYEKVLGKYSAIADAASRNTPLQSGGHPKRLFSSDTA